MIGLETPLNTFQHGSSPYVPDVPSGTLVRLNEHLETQAIADAFCVQISAIAYFMQVPGEQKMIVCVGFLVGGGHGRLPQIHTNGGKVKTLSKRQIITH